MGPHSDIRDSTRWCTSKDVDPQREWIVRSHFGWIGLKFTQQIRFKTVKLMAICNEQKRTIFANSRLELLRHIMAKIELKNYITIDKHLKYLI